MHVLPNKKNSTFIVIIMHDELTLIDVSISIGTVEHKADIKDLKAII